MSPRHLSPTTRVGAESIFVEFANSPEKKRKNHHQSLGISHSAYAIARAQAEDYGIMINTNPFNIPDT